jgi:4-nitrophenyl phosphatase
MRKNILDCYKAFLVDIDGVFLRGGEVIPKAIEGVKKLQELARVILFTNNSTRSRDQLANDLRCVGFSISATDIVNSGFIASKYLKENYGSVRVWPLGEEGLTRELIIFGHDLVSPSEADWVVAGMDRGLTYQRLALGLNALLGGAKLLGTNNDATFPTPTGAQPGAGSVIGAFRGMGFLPEAVVGKPSKIAFGIAMEIAGCQPGEALMIGDSIETDILGSRRAGIDSALVLTGKTPKEGLNADSPIATYVTYSINDLADRRILVEK